MVLFIPGLAIGLVASVRGLALWALAPVLSLTVIVLAATAAPFVHQRWGLAPLLATTVLTTFVIALVRWALARRWPSSFGKQRHDNVIRERGVTPWLFLGFAVAMAAIAIRLMIAIGEPTNFSQTYDNIFHLNAIRYVLDSANASSLTLGGLNISGLFHSAFYPAGWHALTALVAQVGGTSIPIAINAVTLTMAAIVWPLGALLLVRTVSGSRRLVFVTAGIVAAGFAAFPYLMVDYGVLYPFALALAVLAPVVALLATALGFARERVDTRWMSAVLLLVAAPGIALTHPSVLMTAITIAGPMVLLIVIATHRRLQARSASIRAFVGLYAGALVLLGIAAALFIELGPGNMWVGRASLLDALGELLWSGPVGLGPAIVMSVGLFAGLWHSIRTRTHTWLVITWVMFAIMFMVGSTVSFSPLRSIIIGMWYGDVFRVAAMFAIVSLPLAVIGLVWILDSLARLKENAGMKVPHRGIVGILLSLVLIGTQVSNLNTETALAHETYAMTARSKLITLNEYSLLQQVDSLVPVGVTVAGNPWTGTSLVYGLANRPALIMHVKYDTTGTDVIGQHLQDAATDPAVCVAVRKYKVGFVLDFGTSEIHGERHPYPGFENLEHNPSVTLVTRVGTASLWRITACQ